MFFGSIGGTHSCKAFSIALDVASYFVRSTETLDCWSAVTADSKSPFRALRELSRYRIGQRSPVMPSRGSPKLVRINFGDDKPRGYSWSESGVADTGLAASDKAAMTS